MVAWWTREPCVLCISLIPLVLFFNLVVPLSTSAVPVSSTAVATVSPPSLSSSPSFFPNSLSPPHQRVTYPRSLLSKKASSQEEKEEISSSSSSPPSHLKLFSVWSVGAGSVVWPGKNINSSFVNFFFDVNDTDSLAALYAEGYGSSLLHVRERLFHPRGDTQRGLRPDYRKRWEETFELLKPLLTSGATMGVNLGDELAWDCVSHANITTAANLVRASLDSHSPGHIIYYNEAFPPIDEPDTWKHECGEIAVQGYPYVPPAIDWISLDYYPNEGTFEGARRMYNESLYPLLSDHQRVMFVTPAYSCITGGDASFADRFCCHNDTRDGANPPCHGDCERALSEWALEAYNWARTDERFVGLSAWHWSQPGDPSPSSFPTPTSMDPGLEYMTQLRSLYVQIGEEIVSGRLGDVSLSIN